MARKFNPNKIPKRITTFNLDIDVLESFNEICEREDRSRSKLANRLFKDFLKTAGKHS